jgi:hypothetical protein
VSLSLETPRCGESHRRANDAALEGVHMDVCFNVLVFAIEVLLNREQWRNSDDVNPISETIDLVTILLKKRFSTT